MKRLILSLLFAVMLAVPFFSAPDIVFAVQTQDKPKTQIGDSNIYYEYNAHTKTLTVSGSGDTPDFGSDDSSQPWYDWRSDGSVENIVVCEGITSLGNYFFYKVNAESISLPGSLRSIGGYAFSGNKTLKSLTLNAGLQTISNRVFFQCSALAEVHIPKSVASIGRSAFLECPSLVHIDIPPGTKLSAYSVGCTKESKGAINPDMVMGVYRDSPAYTYATRYFVNYTLLDAMEISAGEQINRTYYADSINDEMKFYFTPSDSCLYTFASQGAVDVDCVLTDSRGNEIARSNDISESNLNFSLSQRLNAGEKYCYTVKSIYSEGSFSVSLEVQHSYTEKIIAPKPYEDGYTLHSCVYCGDSYKSNFTDRLAGSCFGSIYPMKSPDGGFFADKPLAGSVLYDFDGNMLGTADENGFFDVEAYRGIVICTPFGAERRIEITRKNTDLGTVCIVNCDFYSDGYINAKDFAVFKASYGKYEENDFLSVMTDINNDGEITFEDWSYAAAFMPYGKIDETVYADLQ